MILNTPQFPHKKQKFNQFIILEKRHNCKPFFAFSPLFATKIPAIENDGSKRKEVRKIRTSYLLIRRP